MKITELRQQYPDLFPEFETEADRVAYEQEQDAAVQARLAEKVAQLKALYASNPTKYAKFAAFTTDEDWYDYAKLCFKSATATQHGTLYNGLQSNFSEENASWEQFSYTEILAMESNGVCVPAEVLAWAHSMQDSDVTAYEIGDDAEASNETEGTGVDSPNSELQKLQKKTQTLSEKSVTANNEASLKFDQFKEISKKAEKIKREQESSKKDALKQIGDLTKEFEELQNKAKNGSELTNADKKRYVELGKMLNGKDGELVTNVQASADELQDLINSMDGLNKDAIKGVDLGEETVDSAEQLALYEMGYKSKETSDKAISMLAGQLKDLFFSGKGKTIASDALDNGNNLIEFSNTLTDQLMMNQYLSLYNFAGEFNVNAAETIDATKETMGDDFNKSGEEFEEDAEVPEEQETDELSMDGLTTMGLGTRKLTKKVQKVGNDSVELAKEAKKELKKLGKEQSELAQEKEAILEEKQQAQLEDTQTEETQEPEKATAAQETAKPDAKADETKSDDVTVDAKAEEIDGKIETNNEKGLTVKEKLQKSLDTNEKYDKFNNKASDVMDTTCNVGTVSVLYGTNLIVGGTQMIAMGTPLLASIFTYPAGVALITQGAIIITAGVGFVGVGADLIAIGVEGVDATDITGTQIDVTDITIQEALEAIEEQEGTGEEQNLTAAQSERREMIAGGATLEEQAKHFRDRSREEKSNSVGGIIETKFVEAQSNKEAEKSEKTAKVIEFTMKGKKAEYDKLAEKKEEAEKERERLEKQMKNPSSLHSAAGVKKNEVDFTEQDEAKMDKLEKQLKSVGDRGQQKLLQSLEKVEGLAEFLADKDEIALTTIDYGDVTQIVGQELIDARKGNILMIFKMLLGVSTRNTGKAASETGALLQEVAAVAAENNEINKTRINTSQTKIEEVTMSPALSVAANSEEEQNEEENNSQQNNSKKDSEADTPFMTNRMIATQNSKAANAPQKQTTSNSKSNSAGINAPEKASASDVSKVGQTGKEVDKGAKESEGFATDAKRDEKTIDKETKTAIRLFNKDQKKMNKIVKQTDALVKEQEALLMEFEELQVQNEEIQARLQEKQNNKPAAVNNNNQQNGQGGLLSQGNGVLAGQSNGLLGGQDTTQDDVKTLEANNARLTIISTRFVKIKKTVQKNQVSVKKIQKTSKNRYKKINKLIREKDKLIKQRQKSEAEKQKKLARQLAIVGVFNNIFSITMAIGTAMTLWPPTAAAGEILVDIGLRGIVQCAIVKASILIANGQWSQALMCLGQAAIQVALSYVGGGAVAGATTKLAQQVIGTVSASLMAVSSTAEMAANIQVASGGEASGWLQTVSSVAGAAGALTGVANGISGGLSGSTFNKVAQVASMSGTVLSSGVQIANLVGEDSKFTQILALVGAGLATAGAVMNLAGKATGIDKAREQKVESTNNTNSTDNTQNTDNTNKTDNTDNADKTNKTNKTDKTNKTNKTDKTDKNKDAKNNKETEKKAQEADNAEKEENKKAADDTKKTDAVAQVAEQKVAGVEATSEQTPVEQKIAEVDNKVQEINTSETAQEIENFDANQQNSEVDEIVADDNLGTDKPVEVDAKADNTDNADKTKKVEADDKADNTDNADKAKKVEADDKADNTDNADKAKKVEADDKAGNTDNADETKKDEADDKVATEENKKEESEEEKQARLEKEEKAAKKAAKQEKFKKIAEITGDVGTVATQGLTLVQGLTKEETVEPAKKKYNGPHSNIKKGASLMKNIKKRKMKSASKRKYA